MKVHFILYAIALLVSSSSAFISPNPFNRLSKVILHDSEDMEHDIKIPQLPAIGGSSFGNPNLSVADLSSDKPSFVGEKFEIQYTCKVCETRQTNRVSRIAYRSGVVISVCKGCSSHHWIADNLGWSDYIGGFEGDTNIEEFFAARGLEEHVNRVSKDVFELEQMMERTRGGTQLPELQ